MIGLETTIQRQFVAMMLFLVALTIAVTAVTIESNQPHRALIMAVVAVVFGGASFIIGGSRGRKRKTS